MKKILLSGFGDWAGSCANPAKAVADTLDGMTIAGAVIHKVIAPSIFNEMIKAVTDEIDRISPDVVIMMGEFGGRSMITVERIAQNLIDAPRYDMGDMSGSRPQDEPVVPGGPAAYYATLPLRAMVRAMRDAGIPSDISDATGTFGCNLLMYGVLNYIAVNQLPIRAGWIHLPALPETAALDKNVGMPSMSVATQVDGLKTAIQAVVGNEKDIDVAIRSAWQF
jgi:pyroglutamyl-peptidase